MHSMVIAIRTKPACAGPLAKRSQTVMSSRTQKGRLGRSLILSGVVLGASLASAAFAGGCPADQK